METTDTLSQKKCIPCEGGVDPLTPEEVATYLPMVKGWVLKEGKIVREFVWKDFVEALAFVNTIGVLAEAEGHHPDIAIHGWNKVKLTLYTHAINGLHLNDFVLASKINLSSKSF